jgi:fatty acid synthase subunit beta
VHTLFEVFKHISKDEHANEENSSLNTIPLDAIIQRMNTKNSPIASSEGIIPLPDIDIPFHSSLLQCGVPAYRAFLLDIIKAHDVKPGELINRWIPNILGTPFTLDQSCGEKCAQRLSESTLAL